MSGTRVLITGRLPAYIGSLMTGVCLGGAAAPSGRRQSCLVRRRVGLARYWRHPASRFTPGDVTEPAHPAADRRQGLRVGRLEPERFDAVVHLAAIVGFPPARRSARRFARLYNTDAVGWCSTPPRRPAPTASSWPSTYTTTAFPPTATGPDERSPLNPQSLYAETKIAAEQLLARRAPRPRAARRSCCASPPCSASRRAPAST